MSYGGTVRNSSTLSDLALANVESLCWPSKGHVVASFCGTSPSPGWQLSVRGRIHHTNALHPLQLPTHPQLSQYSSHSGEHRDRDQGPGSMYLTAEVNLLLLVVGSIQALLALSVRHPRAPFASRTRRDAIQKRYGSPSHLLLTFWGL